MAHLASILCGFLLADRLVSFGALNGPGSPELIDPPSESKHFLHKKTRAAAAFAAAPGWVVIPVEAYLLIKVYSTQFPYIFLTDDSSSSKYTCRI